MNVFRETKQRQLLSRFDHPQIKRAVNWDSFEVPEKAGAIELFKPIEGVDVGGFSRSYYWEYWDVVIVSSMPLGTLYEHSSFVHFSVNERPIQTRRFSDFLAYSARTTDLDEVVEKDQLHTVRLNFSEDFAKEYARLNPPAQKQNCWVKLIGWEITEQ